MIRHHRWLVVTFCFTECWCLVYALYLSNTRWTFPCSLTVSRYLEKGVSLSLRQQISTCSWNVWPQSLHRSGECWLQGYNNSRIEFALFEQTNEINQIGNKRRKKIIYLIKMRQKIVWNWTCNSFCVCNTHFSLNTFVDTIFH